MSYAIACMPAVRPKRTRRASFSAPPPRSVTIGKSSQTVSGCAYYGGGNCPKITIDTHGFSGSYACEFFREDESAPWFSALHYTGDRSGTANAWFGYDATIYVTCDGVESNHVPW